MASGPTDGPRSFIYHTKPEDINSTNNRFAIASYAAKYKSRKKKGRFVIIRSDDIVRNFLTWRGMTVPSSPLLLEQSKCNSDMESIDHQPLLRWGSLLRDESSSFDTAVFFRKFSEANPSSVRPMNIIMDTGSSGPVAIFEGIPPEEICEAFLLVVFSWLSIHNPDQYRSSVLFHQTRILAKLRERLSQGLHDLKTQIILMCTMQTDVGFPVITLQDHHLTKLQAIFGDETALAAHRKGFEALSGVANSAPSE